jgi:hypothetical protein
VHDQFDSPTAYPTALTAVEAQKAAAARFDLPLDPEQALDSKGCALIHRDVFPRSPATVSRVGAAKRVRTLALFSAGRGRWEDEAFCNRVRQCIISASFGVVVRAEEDCKEVIDTWGLTVKCYYTKPRMAMRLRCTRS